MFKFFNVVTPIAQDVLAARFLWVQSGVTGTTEKWMPAT
jgi:hypothetical protein